jgi:uncharacterized protein (TIGR02246 family)
MTWSNRGDTMTTTRTVVSAVLALICLSCRAASQQPLSAEEQVAIADTVDALFEQIPAATNALEFDRLLGYYRDSEDLTYVAAGRITRTHEAFSAIMDGQLGGAAEADLRWLEKNIDVLSRDVAIATADFEFTMVLQTGDTARSSGTYTAVYVRRDGQWKIEYSVHTFPRGR